MSHIIISCMYTAHQLDRVMDERYAPYWKIVYVIYCPINRTKRFDILWNRRRRGNKNNIMVKKIGKKNQLNFNHRCWEELYECVSLCGQPRKLLETELQISTRCNHIIIILVFPFFVSCERSFYTNYRIQKRMEWNDIYFFPSSEVFDERNSSLR